MTLQAWGYDEWTREAVGCLEDQGAAQRMEYSVGFYLILLSSLGVRLKVGARYRKGRSQGVRDLEWLEDFTEGGQQ